MQQTNQENMKKEQPIPVVATDNPALKKVLTAVLEGAAKRDAASEQPAQRCKEYVDCGAWTWQG